MPVFQEQHSGGYRFIIRPNCALDWRTTKVVLLFFAGCFILLGAYFALLGAWLVLPLAGLEFVVLASGFYLSAVAGHTREVVDIQGPVLRVLHGRRHLAEVASLPTNWTRVELKRDPRGWYPSRLLLCCHGKGIEIGSKLVEAEREALAGKLDDNLGFDRPRVDAEAAAPGAVAAGLARRRTR